jgi:O-antigen/teichoic acid export membrane protein
MLGRSKIILLDIIIVSIINLLLNLWLIPMSTILFLNNSAGITGAALATTISMLIFNLILVFQTNYYIKIVPFKRDMLKILIITLILLIPVYLISKLSKVNVFEVLIIGIIFGISYLILILITNCLDKNDFMIINAIKRKLLRR